MDYRTFFGRPLEDWKRDMKDFADNVRGMASEGAYEHCGPDWAWKARHEERRGPFPEFWFPRTNTFETEDGKLVFEFLLPGFDETDINLSFREDRMILRARLPEGMRRGEGRRCERISFQLKDIDWREYTVPAERWDQAQAKAVLKNGILTVTIPPKAESEAAGAVKIEIVKEGK